MDKELELRIENEVYANVLESLRIRLKPEPELETGDIIRQESRQLNGGETNESY